MAVIPLDNHTPNPPNLPPVAPPNPQDKEKQAQYALERAWSWFNLSAKQRMDAVNYYIIGAAFTWAAISQLETRDGDKNQSLAFLCALVGLLFTIVFWGIERRTHRFVTDARKAVNDLEDEVKKLNPYYRPMKDDPKAKVTYGVAFKLLYAASAALYFATVMFLVSDAKPELSIYLRGLVGGMLIAFGLGWL